MVIDRGVRVQKKKLRNAGLKREKRENYKKKKKNTIIYLDTNTFDHNRNAPYARARRVP